jgi:hypothetical protein
MPDMLAPSRNGGPRTIDMDRCPKCDSKYQIYGRQWECPVCGPLDPKHPLQLRLDRDWADSDARDTIAREQAERQRAAQETDRQQHDQARQSAAGAGAEIGEMSYCYSGQNFSVTPEVKYQDLAGRAALGNAEQKLTALGDAWLLDFKQQSGSYQDVLRLREQCERLQQAKLDSQHAAVQAAQNHQQNLCGGLDLADSRNALVSARARMDVAAEEVATVEGLLTQARQRSQHDYECFLVQQRDQMVADLREQLRAATRQWLETAVTLLLDVMATHWTLEQVTARHLMTRIVGKPLTF